MLNFLELHTQQKGNKKSLKMYYDALLKAVSQNKNTDKDT